MIVGELGGDRWRNINLPYNIKVKVKVVNMQTVLKGPANYIMPSKVLITHGTSLMLV